MGVFLYTLLLVAPAWADDSLADRAPAPVEPVDCGKVNDLPPQDKYKRVLNLLLDVELCPSRAADTAKTMHDKLQALSETALGGPDKNWCQDAMIGKKEREDLVKAAKDVILESKVFYKSNGPEDESLYMEILGRYHGEYRAQIMEAAGIGEDFSTWFDFEFRWKGIDRRKLPKKELTQVLRDAGKPRRPEPCKDAYWSLWQLERELQVLSCQIENGIKELDAPPKSGGCKASDAGGQPQGGGSGLHNPESESDITGIGTH